ncbi:MAG TPA: metal ABC transporter permease [Peptococcaceae bacterium]|nr:metal ABC transporter permease [Peptococcaceae bacterium]
MAEWFAYDFMQRALVAGVVAGLLCGLVSFFVVLKRLAFVGAGISHSALGGVAIGVLLGVNPILAATAFCTLVAWAIGLVSRKGELYEDTAIGIFFATAMAFGIALLSLAVGYYADLFSFLFGSILSVTQTDLILLVVTGVAVAAFLLLFFKELLFICFDAEAASAAGVPTGLLYYGLLTSLALTVVVTVKILGIVLASALLVMPAATGYELCKNFRGLLAVAAAHGIIAAAAGLWLSYRLNLPSGATIVLCAAALFFAAFVLSPHRRARRRTHLPSA